MRDVGALVETGHEFFAQGRLEEASEAYRSAIWYNLEERDLGTMVYRNLAHCHLTDKNWLRAGNAYTEALAREQSDPVAHAFLLGERACVYLYHAIDLLRAPQQDGRPIDAIELKIGLRKVGSAESDLEVARNSLTMPQTVPEPVPVSMNGHENPASNQRMNGIIGRVLRLASRG